MSRNPSSPRDQPVGSQPEDRSGLDAGSRRGPGAVCAPAVVSSGPVLWRLVVPGDGMALFPGDLAYKSTDPYAVHIAFSVDSDTLEWVFARALLIGGLREPVGIGDVVISPSRHDGVDTVQITLKADEAFAVLEAPAHFVVAFLNLTCKAVPPGTERRHIDLDHLARRLVQNID